MKGSVKIEVSYKTIETKPVDILWINPYTRWAVESGIISGYGNGQLGPSGLATRAQAAQMLMNFFENQ